MEEGGKKAVLVIWLAWARNWRVRMGGWKRSDQSVLMEFGPTIMIIVFKQAAAETNNWVSSAYRWTSLSNVLCWKLFWSFKCRNLLTLSHIPARRRSPLPDASVEKLIGGFLWIFQWIWLSCRFHSLEYKRKIHVNNNQTLVSSPKWFYYSVAGQMNCSKPPSASPQQATSLHRWRNLHLQTWRVSSLFPPNQFWGLKFPFSS